jgi:hypothetical protein
MTENMSELLFYKEPVALNRDKHHQVKFTPVKDYSFTSKVNSVPLTAIEFFEASRDLPVLFSKDQEENYFPVALLGLTNKGHALIDEEGKWASNYVPAFIRRYPFVLNNEGTVFFDEASGLLSDDEGNELFSDDGKNTETLDNIVTFLNHFDQEHKRTVDFCAALKQQELFKPFNLQVMPKDSDKPLRLEGLFAIDDKKFENLNNDVVTEWFKKAYVAWVYAHLHSLGAIQKIAQK